MTNNYNPLFTIITPSFNQASFISQTIDSVLHQSYNKIEYIIVDGNSSDGTSEILQRYRGVVDHIIIENDNGQSDAINKGLALANGSLLMWLNSDDILLPHSIEAAVDCFYQNHDALIVHGHSELFGHHQRTRLIGECSGDWLTQYPAYMCYPQPASFFRKELINMTGYLDTQLNYAMDFDLTVRAHLIGKIVYKPYLFSRYRIHEKSKSNDTFLFVREWREVLSRYINSNGSLSVWQKLLIAEGFHTGTRLHYSCSAQATIPEFEDILFNHLHKCAHMLYQAGQDTEFLKYLVFLERLLPQHYNSSGLDGLKSKILVPPRLRSIYRKFARR